MTGTVLERIEDSYTDYLIGLEDHMSPDFPTKQKDIKYIKRLLKDIKAWQHDYESGEDDGWRDMETAPKDGTEILVCRDNDLGWEYDIVYWRDTGSVYPWKIIGNFQDGGYPEGRLDYWMELPDGPYKHE